MEVIGRPTRRRKAVNLAYRLIGAVRFNPPAPAREPALCASAAATGSA